MSRHSLLNDIIFKIVFATPQNERLLMALINAILDLSGEEKITWVDVLNPFVDKTRYEDRGLILDVKCSDHLGRRYNVEVQLSAHAKYIERSLYYLAKLFSEQLSAGDPFTVIKRTVGISLLDYALFPQVEDLHSCYRFYDVAHGRELTDVIEIHYVELSKFRPVRPLRTHFERWLYALKFGDLYESGAEALPEELQEEEEIVMALDAMRRAYADDAIRFMIEDREKAQHQVATDLEFAREEGKAEGEVAAGRDSVLAVIQARFGDVSEEERRVVGSISDPTRLRDLLMAVAQAPDRGAVARLLQ